MPRKQLIRVKESPYHVTARCNNKEPFPCSLEAVWKIISREIKEIVERYECKIHAFVLMSNHFHLLITTPKDDLGVIMQSFMISITKKLNSNSGRSTLRNVIDGDFSAFLIEPPIGHRWNIPNERLSPFLQWLNRSFTHEQQLAIQRGFRRTVFFPTKMGWKKMEKNSEGLKYST